jgi:hypothetical protein
MALRFFSLFQDDKAQEWRIEIHDTGFSGSAEEFNVNADGFVLKYNGDTEKPLQPIIGSTVTIPMLIPSEDSSEFDDFVTDLQNSNEDKFTVVIREGLTGSDDVYWVGVLQPEQINIMDESLPTLVELTAADDIANLKGVEYTDDGTPYTGQASILVHLIRILNNTRTTQHWGGTDIFLATQEYFKTTSQTTEDTYLQVGFVYEDIYIDDAGNTKYPSCYEILLQICETMQASLFQARGRWFFLPRMYLNNTGVYNVNEYADTGVLLNANQARNYPYTIAQNSSNAVRLAGGEFSYINALKSVQREYEFKGNVPLIDTTWSKSDLGVTSWSSDDFILPSGGNLAVYCPIIIVQDADGSRIGDKRAIRYELQMTIKCGTYYHKRIINPNNLSSTFILGDGDQIDVFVTTLNAKSWDTTAANRTEWFTTAVDAEYGDQENITFQIVTAGIPADSTGIEVQIRMNAYEADGDTSGTITTNALDGATVNGVLKVWVGDGSDSSGDSIVYSSETNNNAREVFELEKALIGDQISDVATRGALRRADGNYTTEEWYSIEDTDSEYYVNELLCIEHLALRKFTVPILRHTLYSSRIYFDTVFNYASNRWAAMGWTFTANLAHYDVELFRIQRTATDITVAQSDRVPSNVPDFDISQTEDMDAIVRQVASVGVGGIIIRDDVSSEFGLRFTTDESLTEDVILPLPKSTGNTTLAKYVLAEYQFTAGLVNNDQYYIVRDSTTVTLSGTTITAVGKIYGFILPTNAETLELKMHAYSQDSSSLTFTAALFVGSRTNSSEALTLVGSVSISPAQNVITVMDFEESGLELTAGDLLFLAIKKTSGTTGTNNFIGNFTIAAT